MLRIHEIKLNIGETTDKIPDRLLKKLGRRDVRLSSFQIIKESIDARDKGDIKLVYSVDFTLDKICGEAAEKVFVNQMEKSCKGLKLELAPNMEYQYPEPGTAEMVHRPVVVGFGPCGMFAALILAQMGCRPIVIERGKSLDERIKDVQAFWENGVLNEESNVQFGEGGAGTFSDGKLTTQIKDPRVRKVLEEFVAAGAPTDILYKQKPHIGTDVLRNVVYNIRNRIRELGGEIHFESKLTGMDIETKVLKALIINESERLKTQDVVLSIGHSARDTFNLLYENGIPMEQKPFSIGVRIEHPQRRINKAQYGKNWETYALGAADYKLSYRCKNGRGVYTFCMCPGGYVIAAASQEGMLVTNGMSLHSRAAENANSALLVDVGIADFPGPSPLAGIEFQQKYERLAFKAGGCDYRAPFQSVGDFTGRVPEKGMKLGSGTAEPSDSDKVKPSYRPGVVQADLTRCLPEFAVEALREAIPELGKKLAGFDSPEALMTGIETRSSSPVRILRDKCYMSSVRGIYPAGEGAGYAGGIVSAAVDGIKIAEQIAKKYKSRKVI